MTKFIASMVLSAGFWMVPAVSIPASAFFQNSTRALMPLPHELDLTCSAHMMRCCAPASSWTPGFQNRK